mgnify:CR=1 FL=1
MEQIAIKFNSLRKAEDAQKLKEYINAIEGVRYGFVHRPSSQAFVLYDGNIVRPGQLEVAVGRVGYSVKSTEDTTQLDTVEMMQMYHPLGM